MCLLWSSFEVMNDPIQQLERKKYVSWKGLLHVSLLEYVWLFHKIKVVIYKVLVESGINLRD